MRMARSSPLATLNDVSGRLEVLRDLGGRLDYVVRRYARLVFDLADERVPPDMLESVELMNGHLGFVVRRLQDVMVAEWLERQAAGQVSERSTVRCAD
jgi:hypothetical protein